MSDNDDVVVGEIIHEDDSESGSVVSSVTAFPAALPPLESIWEDDKVCKMTSVDGRKEWKCLWCKNVFAQWNHSKALHHVAKQVGQNIRLCHKKMDEMHKARYSALFSKQESKRKKRQLANLEANLSGDLANQEAGAALLIGRNKKGKTGVASVASSALSSSAAAISHDMKPAAFDDVADEQRKMHQTKLFDTPDPQADSQLTMAIADMIHSCGLPFALASLPKFRKVLSLARIVSSKYKPPSRNQIGGELLDLNYEMYMKRMDESLVKENATYGLSLYGDGATVKRMPLINILAAGAHNPAAVLEIVDCTKQMEEGKKKDAAYIAGLFKPHIEKFENISNGCVDCCFFDGASNVQKGGQILEAKFPRITTIHGAEHVVSLFFSDIFKIPEFLLLKKFNRLLYNFFGSGSMHMPYALFQKQSRSHNKGRSIGFILSSDVRMGGHVISMLRSLRLKNPLMSTVSSVEFLQGKVQIDRKHLSLLKSKEYWDIMRILIRAVFPMLLVLRLADKKTAIMDKLFFYVPRLDQTMERSKELMDGISDITSRRNEFSSMLSRVDSIRDEYSDDDDDNGDAFDDASVSSVASESSSSDEDEQAPRAASAFSTMSLGDKVSFFWQKRRVNLVSPYAVAGWMLCPIAEIKVDAMAHTDGDHRLTVEKLLVKLYSGEVEEDPDKIAQMINTFWEEYDQFQLKEGPYNRPHIWHPNNGDLLKGESHVWHKKNSIPYTKVLGSYAARVCSKMGGIGSAERAWSDVKHLKTDKRSHLGANALKKQSTIYGAACMETAERTEKLKTPEAAKIWTDEDFDDEFDMLSASRNTEKTAAAPRRVLRCYVEDWEREDCQKRDPVAEARLLKKYGDLEFLDVDTNKMFYTDPNKLNWTRRSTRGGGFSVIAYSEDYDGNNPNEDHIEPFAITDGNKPFSAIHELLQMYYTSLKDKNVKVITFSEGDDNDTEEDEVN